MTADWGDILEITVTSRLTSNGTGLHWHGLRQLGSNEMDGVNGITECPLAPGETKTYRFQATQYGTTVSGSRTSVVISQWLILHSGIIHITQSSMLMASGAQSLSTDPQLQIMTSTLEFYHSRIGFTHPPSRSMLQPSMAMGLQLQTMSS